MRISDKERDAYLTSIEAAAKKAGEEVQVDTFVANNTEADNPGYFGAVKKLMQDVDVAEYDYAIVSNVDLTLAEDFFINLAAYDCPEDTGWIAPRIWSPRHHLCRTRIADYPHETLSPKMR